MITLVDLNKIVKSEHNEVILKEYLRAYRGITDERVVDELSTTLLSKHVFYVPSSAYLEGIVGNECKKIFSDYYLRGICLMSGCLVFPLVSVYDDVIGLVLNDPKGTPKYKYPSAYIGFHKSRIFNMSEEDVKKMYKEDYCIIVEGIFDEYQVRSCGFNCTFLAGSDISDDCMQLLETLSNVIVIADEDSAGHKLNSQAKELRTNVSFIKLPCNDIDKFLRNWDNRQEFKAKITEHISTGFVENLITLRGCGDK